MHYLLLSDFNLFFTVKNSVTYETVILTEIPSVDERKGPWGFTKDSGVGRLLKVQKYFFFTLFAQIPHIQKTSMCKSERHKDLKTNQNPDLFYLGIKYINFISKADCSKDKIDVYSGIGLL